MPKGVEPELMDQWKVHDAIENYGIRNWGKGYFGINSAGHVVVEIRGSAKSLCKNDPPPVFSGVAQSPEKQPTAGYPTVTPWHLKKE